MRASALFAVFFGVFFGLLKACGEKKDTQEFGAPRGVSRAWTFTCVVFVNHSDVVSDIRAFKCLAIAFLPALYSCSLLHNFHHIV